MTILDAWVRTAAAKAVGWTLLHSLWEGAAIALALAIVLAIARSSRVRYAASCVAMLGLIVGFGATLCVLMPREISRPVVRMVPAPLNPALDAQPAANRHTTWDASDLLPWLAPIWLAGVLLFQLRCLASWMATGRLRRIGVCGASSEWRERLDNLRVRLRMGGAVTLLESCFAEVPVVIGHLRPVILMPVGLLAGLPAAQIEAILLHELAHIRRADYLVNLMQTLVEGLLFYHPAAWWISNSIRSERENCCDDLVVTTNGEAHEYARALAALAENRWTMREAAVAATGGNLVKRIRRILARPQESRTGIAPALAVGLLIVTGAALLAAPLLFAQAPGASEAAPTKYDKWLKEEVAYIITDQERADFKKLRTDPERDRFVEDFWSRRDPTPGTPENEYKDEHYRRIAYTNSRFTIGALPGWKTDRGRIYIQYGPPDEIDLHPANDSIIVPGASPNTIKVTFPFEVWAYRYIEGIGDNVVLRFLDEGRAGNYTLKVVPSQNPGPVVRVQKEINQAKSDLQAFEDRLKGISSADVVSSFRVKREVERAESNLHAVEKELGSAASVTDQVKLLESRAQMEEAQKELEKLERTLSTLESQISPAQKELLASQERLNNQQLRIAQIQRSFREHPNKAFANVPSAADGVFLSGTGPQAVVVVFPNRSMLVTIPLEFVAAKYLIEVHTIALDGKTARSRSMSTTSTGSSYTVEEPALPPGSYMLNVDVKGAGGENPKTYTLNFAVN